MLRATIEACRRDVELFYQYVYNKAYKQGQDLEILRHLSELDEYIKDVFQMSMYPGDYADDNDSSDEDDKRTTKN